MKKSNTYRTQCCVVMFVETGYVEMRHNSEQRMKQFYKQLRMRGCKNSYELTIMAAVLAVNVLCPNGRRVTVKKDLNTPLLQVRYSTSAENE